MKRNKRKIPILKISLTPGASYEQLISIPEVRNFVMENTYIAIEDGLNKNKKSTTLFDIADSDYSISLEKSKWVGSLEKVIEFYIEKEDYNRCINIKSLIDRLK